MDQVHVIFRIAGIAVGLYVAQGLATGAVYARSRWWGRTFYRDQEPFKYWCAIASYTGLAIALVFVF